MADVDHLAMATAVIVEELVSFTLPALCQASGADQAQIHALVAEGLLQPTGPNEEGWRFSGDALAHTRRALRLSRELELNWSAVALVMDLLAQIERLRAELRVI